MNIKNRIEVLEEVVGELLKRVNELEEENRILNEMLKNKLDSKPKITKLYNDGNFILLYVDKE